MRKFIIILCLALMFSLPLLLRYEYKYTGVFSPGYFVILDTSESVVQEWRFQVNPIAWWNRIPIYKLSEIQAFNKK